MSAAPRRRTPRLRVGQWFALSLGALVLVALAGLISGVLALNSLRDNRTLLVDRIDPTLISAETFLTAMLDQETGVRGYSLTADESLLAPFERGSETARSALGRITRLSSDPGRARAVGAAAGAWREGYAKPTIAGVRAGQTNPTNAQVLSGNRRFDAIRASVTGLESSLNRARATARDAVASASTRLRAIVVSFALATLLAVLATALVLRRTIIGPVSGLARQVRSVASGGFEEHVQTDGAREISELGADVDRMRARIVSELDALAQARDDLETSNADLEQFAYVASHDLQEPLRKVASFTQMLQRRYAGQLDERADTYIEFAVDGAKRMQELINDLLAFSRVGRITEEPVLVDCNALVERARTTLSEKIAESGARLETAELPPVLGEASLLGIVFTNLIGNGLKFRGDDPPAVRVSVERSGEDWCFTVADNGIGIETEYADRIFVIFQRLHPRSVYEGTGIGLALCRKVVEHHGGRIWLDTEAERGATFHFTLPAIQEDEQ